MVEVPKKLSREQKNKLREFERTLSDKNNEERKKFDDRVRKM